MRISDWSSDVGSSDLVASAFGKRIYQRGARSRTPTDVVETHVSLLYRCKNCTRIDENVIANAYEMVCNSCNYVTTSSEIRVSRLEESRVGKECGSRFRSRWSPYT